ncbi:hypothetical protein LZ659_16685 [Shewanella indica]|uniref:hypothetical protein n=1 Tax=Shewanella indica TaxID=768528 RepID=UPI001F345A7E|nr:hypothetical protein [Shewanella indica]MCE9793238.1 hypothetical protein [Shewanella indica]
MDFAQCPRLFFAEPFADILSSMEPFGVERIKNPYKPDEDMYAEIDIGTRDELDSIAEVLYDYFQSKEDTHKQNILQTHCLH